MYSPIDPSKDAVPLNSIERELFRRRTKNLRRELQTCKETFSSNHKLIQSRKTTLKGYDNLLNTNNVGKNVMETLGEEPNLGGESVGAPERETEQSRSAYKQTDDDGYLKFVKLSNICDDLDKDISQQTKSCDNAEPRGESEFIGDSDNEKEDNVLNSASVHSRVKSRETGKQRPSYMRPIKCKPHVRQPRSGNKLLVRPKSKKFSCAIPTHSYLDQTIVPSKPKSPRKQTRSKPHYGHQIYIEPGRNLDPAQSIAITKFRQRRSSPLGMGGGEDILDNTQQRIKEFLEKACADAARSRTKMAPTVSVSDLASIDEQQTSMPILVEGVLAPEEKKRQVSKVYPMRSPSPHFTLTSHLQGSRSSSRVTRCDHPPRGTSPLSLPPIILPPIRENKEFKPRRCSLADIDEGEVYVSKPITEKEWRSLRKCRYLRIPDPPGQVKFDIMDNIESVFK